MPGYWEEHHDQAPEHVPHLPVTGTVRTIQTLHYAFAEGANPGELIIRPDSEVAVELDAVPGAGRQLPGRTREHEVLAYRVQLEVADDAELPAYVLDEQALLVPVIGSSTGAAGALFGCSRRCGGHAPEGLVALGFSCHRDRLRRRVVGGAELHGRGHR
ncbi:hypothetical protein [Kocuria rosea]|uniref:hypothetical protein n=1 Tax=Kocuria TaxID=57493 RepID=UPI0030179EA5